MAAKEHIDRKEIKMMNPSIFIRICIAILLLDLFALRISAQTNQITENSEGWRAAKWGMTELEVLDVFKGEAKKTDKELETGNIYEVGLAQISKVEVSNISFIATFIFEKEKRTLKRIKLLPKDNGEISEQLFSLLEQELTTEYGKPTFSKDGEHPFLKPSILKKRSWNQGKTEISLTYGDWNSEKSLALIYEKASNDKGK